MNQLQKVEIRVLPATPWEPILAERICASLFTSPAPIALTIEATAQSVDWSVLLPQRQVAWVENAIFAYYPSAQIEATGFNPVYAGYRQYDFGGAQHFALPFRFAADFPHHDPLAELITAIGYLQPNEHIIYQMTLAPADKKLYQLGSKLITRSTVGFMDVADLGTAFYSLEQKLRRQDRVRRYGGEQQRLAEFKLNSPLMEAAVSLKIQAATVGRANQLAERVLPALAYANLEGANALYPAGDETFPIVLSPQETALLWHLPSNQCHHPLIGWARSASAPAPRRQTSDQARVVLGVNSYQGRERQVILPDSDRVTHTVILGGTAVGKSTLMHNEIHQDAADDKGVGALDPHGALVKAIMEASIPPHRLQDVIYFDMTDTEYPIGLNMLAVPPGVAAETVASQVVNIMRKMLPDTWSETRMESAFYAVVMTLITLPGATILDVARLFYDSDFRTQLLQRDIDPVARQFWEYQFDPANPGLQMQIAAPIINRISKFTRNPLVRRVVCQKESLDFTQILNGNKIFLANLSGLEDIEMETMGALLISKFQMAAMGRARLTGDRARPFYLYIDEVQNMTTTSLPKLLSEARKSGLSLTTANQYLEQLSGDTLEAIMGNAGTNILFKLGPYDAPSLSPFVSPAFSRENLLNLSRFEAIVKMQVNKETQPAFNMRTFPPPPPSPHAAQMLAQIQAQTRRQYGRHRDEIDAELKRQMFDIGNGQQDDQDEGTDWNFNG